MRFLEWIKYNFWIIIVCLAAVLMCILFYGNSAAVIVACNDYWVEQFETQCTNPVEIDGVLKNELFNFSIENNKGVNYESQSNSKDS